MHDREDLVESVIHPGLDDAQEALLEVFEEMEGQLDKEVARLAELRKIRTEDPGEYGVWRVACHLLQVKSQCRAEPQIHSSSSTMSRRWRESTSLPTLPP